MKTPNNIIALGKSLGGGIASELALRTEVGALILQSTYTNIADAGADLFPFLPVRWVNTIKYDTLSKLPKIHVPVMIVHSRGDKTIRFRHAERNYAAANPPKLFWEIQGGHVGVRGVCDRVHAERAGHRAERLPVITVLVRGDDRAQRWPVLTMADQVRDPQRVERVPAHGREDGDPSEEGNARRPVDQRP